MGTDTNFFLGIGKTKKFGKKLGKKEIGNISFPKKPKVLQNNF